MHVVSIVKDAIAHKNEQLKQIRLVTGGIIDMWSLEEPDSGRGRKYKRVVIDECEKAKKLEIAWQGTIRATLTDYKGDCWFLSTPKFGDTFFKELFTYKDDPERQHEWQGWAFTTYDNPFMDAKEIDDAKRTLADIYFRCEYLAEDVIMGDMLWAFAFEYKKHVDKVEYNPERYTYLSFDFNRNPISCIVAQWYNDQLRVVRAIKLANSDIYKLCDHIRVLYPNATFFVTGDATGKNSSAMVADNINYYTIIKHKLGLAAPQLKIPTVNPHLADNQVLVNSVLANYPVIIDKELCKDLIYDFQNVKMLPSGEILKADRNDPKQQSDALDGFRYLINLLFKDFLKNSQIKVK